MGHRRDTGEGHRTSLDAVIARVLHHAGDVAKTKLVKLVYLVDIAWVQMTGQPLTNTPYVWHKRGPYSEVFATGLDRLVLGSCVTFREGTTSDGHEYTLYSLLGSAPEVDPEVDLVVRDITAKFAILPLNDLLAYVYETPPMQSVQVQFDPLDLPGTVRQEFRAIEDAADMLRQRVNDNGRRTPIDEVLDAIGAR